MKIENYSVKELSQLDLVTTTGGNPIIAFVLTAIVGGIVYEVTKAGWEAALNGYIEASKNGVYEGMPSPSFRH